MAEGETLLYSHATKDLTPRKAAPPGSPPALPGLTRQPGGPPQLGLCTVQAHCLLCTCRFLGEDLCSSPTFLRLRALGLPKKHPPVPRPGCLPWGPWRTPWVTAAGGGDGHRPGLESGCLPA